MLLARASLRPIAFVMLPVMVLTLVSVLQGLGVLAYVALGYPGGLVLALAWTRYRLAAKPVEICVVGPGVTMRSAWDVASGAAARPVPVWDVRVGPDEIGLGVGREYVSLLRHDWPRWDALGSRLASARADAGHPSSLSTTPSA